MTPKDNGLNFHLSILLRNAIVLAEVMWAMCHFVRVCMPWVINSSQSILCDVITYPCFIYFLAHEGLCRVTLPSVLNRVPCCQVPVCIRSRYIAVIFVEDLTKDPSKFAREGEVWGVLHECKDWSKFCHYDCCSVCNIVLYMTAIYRQSPVKGSRVWSAHSVHDDVIKWKHFPRNWPFVRGIHRWPVNSPHKGQWRGALTSSLICVWINGWVNNREAADLRRYRAHYDVTVMIYHSALWLSTVTVMTI